MKDRGIYEAGKPFLMEVVFAVKAGEIVKLIIIKED